MRKNILDLRPTQFSLGFTDVDDKIHKIHSFNDPDHGKKVPVVLGPNGQTYIIDNHHFIRAMWESNYTHVHVNVVADYSKLSVKKFCTKMKRKKYVFLMDQFGDKRKFQDLPRTIRTMSDNPYRSLAFIVREGGAFNKSTVPFAEFYWAELFRAKLHKIDPLSVEGIRVANKVCRSKAASKLPGFKEKM
jgi:hypothetical protein